MFPACAVKVNRYVQGIFETALTSLPLPLLYEV